MVKIFTDACFGCIRIIATQYQVPRGSVPDFARNMAGKGELTVAPTHFYPLLPDIQVMSSAMFEEGSRIGRIKEGDSGGAIVGPYKYIEQETTPDYAGDVRMVCAVRKADQLDSSHALLLISRLLTVSRVQLLAVDVGIIWSLSRVR